MDRAQEIKKQIRDLKLKQKITTNRMEWNDIQSEIEKLNAELNQIDMTNTQHEK